jgi:hypothetical protein
VGEGQATYLVTQYLRPPGLDRRNINTGLDLLEPHDVVGIQYGIASLRSELAYEQLRPHCFISNLAATRNDAITTALRQHPRQELRFDLDVFVVGFNLILNLMSVLLGSVRYLALLL